MTKAEIIAELRRSAAEDVAPWCSVAEPAFDEAYDFCDGSGSIFSMRDGDRRTFFLFVACALEDE